MFKFLALGLTLSTFANADYLDRVFFALPTDCSITEATGESTDFKGSKVEFMESAGARAAVLTIMTESGNVSYQYDVTSRNSSGGKTEIVATLPGVENERYLTLKVKMKNDGRKVVSGEASSYMPAYPKDPDYQGTFKFECK